MVKDTLYDGVCLNSAPVGEILLDPMHNVLRRHVQSVHSKWRCQTSLSEAGSLVQ